MSVNLAVRVARECVEDGTVPGIATATATDGDVSEACFGLLSRSPRIPMEPNSIMRINSLTKPVVSVAILMLRERGLLDLGDPLHRWMPQFQRSNAPREFGATPSADITVRDLLTHTSGLGYGIGTGDVEESYRAAGLFTHTMSLTHSLATTVDLVSGLPVAFQAGTCWRYSIAFDVLGHLVELITDMTLGDFLSLHVFDPIGMVDTGFFVPPDSARRFGPLYAPRTDGFTIVDGTEGSTYLDVDVIQSGGSGLVSTARDYLKFARMLHAGGSADGVRILQPDSVRSMTSNQLQGSEFPVRWDAGLNGGSMFSTPDLGYGYGLGVQADGRRRYGWGGASGCQMWVYPGQDLVAVALTQSMGDYTASDAFFSALSSPG